MNSFTDDRHSYAICLIGHGSRDPEGIEEFLTLWKKLRERKICRTTEYGFLEFAKPSVTEALSACHLDGIKYLIILPGILLPGEHSQRDIPNAVGDHPNTHFAEPLGTQPQVMAVCRERIEEAENFSQKSIARSKTLFMTVAHGSHDYNSQVEKSFHLLGEKLGFGKTGIHFAGSSQDSLEESLEKLMPQEFHRVILLPFFLFSGVWVKRVHTLADTLQEKYPNTEFLKASCLKHHEWIVDALVQRAHESISSK